MSKERFDLPFQVQNLIIGLNDKRESVNSRFNYFQRLLAIQKAIDEAFELYNKEETNTGAKK
jgi:hypothetical protein